MTTLFRAFHITDLHLSPLNRTPQSRSDTYHDDVGYELDQFAAIVEREQPHAVLVSGDYFHNKNQLLYSPPDIEHYRRKFAAISVPVHSIPGNHDLPKSSYDLVEGTAYQNLLNSSSGHLTDVYLAPQTYPINESGIKTEVHIHGVPYFPLDKLFMDYLPALEAELATKSGLKIVLLHPDALPRNDLPLHFETCSWDDLCNALPSANVICLGHIHQSFPVYQRQGPKGPQLISKPWSFGRVVKDYFATSEHFEHEHRPMYADIHFRLVEGKPNLSVEYREIPYIPFARAFNPESLRRDIEKSGKIASFITSLRANYGTVEDAFKIEDPEAFLARSQMTPEVREIINRYLNEV